MRRILAGRATLTGLWRHPDFVRLWLGRTVSRFGSHIGGTALSLTAVLALRATPAQMGLLAALESAPLLAVGLVAGVWVDRLRRRPIMLAADFGRAALLTSIPLAALLGRLRMEHLYVVAALAGLLTVFFDVADQSLLPTLVPPERLAEGNGKLAASDSLAEIGGQAMAGGLVQLLGGPAAILVDAASFLCSALCVGSIRAPEPPVSTGRGHGLWREIIAGLRVALGHPLLRALAGSAATATFFGNFIGALYALYVIRTLGLPVSMVGILVAAGGVGALAGALVAGRVVRRFGLGPTLCGTALVAGGAQALNPLAHGPAIVSVALLLAAQLVGDIAYAIRAIRADSLRQAVAPGRQLGRVTASMRVLTEGTAPLGALVGGALGGAIGPRPTLATAACGLLLAALWLFLSPVRTLHELPAATE